MLIYTDAALIVISLLVIIGVLASGPDAIQAVVDLVRGAVGPEPVALAENTYYGITDAVQRETFSGVTTPGFWSPPTSVSSDIPSAPANGKTAPPPTPALGVVTRPRDIAPLYPNLAAPGEGTWIPIPTPPISTTSPVMYKTFLHADSARPYARVAIVALDATRLRLHAVAGTAEPAAPAYVTRPGLVPSSNLAQLVAVFNGGFKAIHGHYGMMVDGQTILPPQPEADTIALYRDGHARIAPWSAISDTLPLMQSYRQTPEFLAYQGRVNPALGDERIIKWGATVSGQTAIWRSACGISADGRMLYYAAGDSLTAQRIAEAVVATGASDVAELDANLGHEQFVVYTPARGNFAAQVLIDQMSHSPGMFVSTPSPRDFFYLTLAR